MDVLGQAAQLVSIVTTPTDGGVAIPVYGYSSAPTDGRRILGSPAIPVVILSASDLEENGGTYVLSGQPLALPVVTASVESPVLGQVPLAVYPVNSYP